MKLLADNRKARYDYDFIEDLEAGVVLSGQEVKSAKHGGLRLRGSYARVRGGALELIGARIAPWPPAGPLPSYDPERTRTLLVHRREAERIAGRIKTERLTLVPRRAYTRRGRIKIVISLARNKRAFEKRAAIRERELRREVGRAISRTRKNR